LRFFPGVGGCTDQKVLSETVSDHSYIQGLGREMCARRAGPRRNVSTIINQDSRGGVVSDFDSPLRQFEQDPCSKSFLSNLNQVYVSRRRGSDLNQDILELGAMGRGCFSGCAAGNQIKDRW